MRFIVKDKNEKVLAILDMEDDGEIVFQGGSDLQFRDWVEKSISKGIKQGRDIFDPNTQTFTMVEGPVSKSDANYSLIFKDLLQAQGYIVDEKHPEVEEEIKKLLVRFPDNNPDKVDILKRLPEMSYLEQTTILEGLKRID